VSYIFTVTPNPLFALTCAVLGVVSPIALIVALWRGPLGPGRRVFGLSMCLVVSGLFSFLLVGSYRVYIEVSPNNLKIDASPAFTNKVFTPDDVVEAFLTDLSQDSAYRPTTRAIALGWGAYRVGWYMLSSGEKALILTEQPLVLCLKMVEGYYVMMGPSRFDEFLRAFNSTLITVET